MISVIVAVAEVDAKANKKSTVTLSEEKIPHEKLRFHQKDMMKSIQPFLKVIRLGITALRHFKVNMSMRHCGFKVNVKQLTGEN